MHEFRRVIHLKSFASAKLTPHHKNPFRQKRKVVEPGKCFRALLERECIRLKRGSHSSSMLLTSDEKTPNRSESTQGCFSDHTSTNRFGLALIPNKSTNSRLDIDVIQRKFHEYFTFPFPTCCNIVMFSLAIIPDQKCRGR